ncbi:ABC transporter substrate-binding protein [Pseudomonas sp. LRF_L74]|uniref:ABC transporter substrate-binding protein n=1 Tax=Pseudomonas sp. LRF_L74 TaxID=3369422 RepID=UPI003F5DA592
MTESVRAYYTICPVLVASNVAVELGWLDEEFERAGARADYLRSLPREQGWLPHFNHSLSPLFRDGGAIPTIAAKADRVDSVLLGLTATQRGGQILARASEGLHHVRQLRGRCIGLPRYLGSERIDFVRAISEYAFEAALGAAGLAPGDVHRLDLDGAEQPPEYLPARRPSGFWPQLVETPALQSREARALLDGQVDAIYSRRPGFTRELVESGAVTVLADLGQVPDWTQALENGPFTMVVDRAFAEAHPQVVVAFLRASIRAGRWINGNRDAAAQLLLRVTSFPDTQLLRAAIGELDFVPNLSPRNLAAIELRRRFLRSRGYLNNDFAVDQWADPRYLAEAHASLSDPQE